MSMESNVFPLHRVPSSDPVIISYEIVPPPPQIFLHVVRYLISLDPRPGTYQSSKYGATNLNHAHRTSNTMRWPPWSPEKDDDDKKVSGSWSNSLNATDWTHYTDPRTVVPTLLLTSAILMSVRIYSLYLRRIPDAGYIRPGFFRRRSVFGIVTRVGDGDNFHLFHTPGGRLAGWGWMPGRKIPEKGSNLKGKTVYPPVHIPTPQRLMLSADSHSPGRH